MKPTVSINLCVLNGENYLRKALESIVSQTYKDWELIIINDGSTDSTEIIVKDYINQGYPIIYHYQENHGLGYSRNEALKRSQGEYVAFIDHDDLWLPTKLEKQIPLFINSKDVGIVISNAFAFKDDGVSKVVYSKNRPATGHVFREILKNDFIYLSSAVIRRSALDSLEEWFDERFRYVEDGELFARICYKWKLDYIDEPLIKRRIHRNMSMILRPDLSPKETEMMIDKFISIYSDFEKEYKKEILFLRYQIQYNYALLDWKQNKNYKVRERLRPYLASNIKAIIPFIISVLPFEVYQKLLFYYRKYIKRMPVIC